MTEKEIRAQVAEAEVYQPQVEDEKTGKMVPERPTLWRVDVLKSGWSADVDATDEKDAREQAIAARLERQRLLS